MGTEHPTDQTESVGNQANSSRPVPSEWQFSLRGLLIATVIVSICLALGTYFVGVAFTVLVVIILQVATLLSADWLIRPVNRQMLAFVTAGSWMIVGSGLLIIGAKVGHDAAAFELIYGTKVGYDVVQDDYLPGLWAAVAFLVLLAAFCFGFGWHRWRRLTAHRRANL